MNCEDCNALLSSFLDSELDPAMATAVRSHLAECDGCALVCEDLAAVIGGCSEVQDDVIPPNANAMWLRIHNLIESDARQHPDVVEPPPPRRIWQLSFSQLSAAVVFIAIVSSLLTVVAVRNYSDTAPPDLPHLAERSPFEKFLGRIGLVETPQEIRERRHSEHQAAIEYWNARVQARRAHWDRATREAFDRNLNVIDESVREYTVILQQDPDDELSGEMLDAVLTDKMNLLRDFADL